MPLDPQAHAWLDARRAAGAKPYQELGVDEARRVADATALELFGALDHVATIEDVDAGGVPARTYRPDGEDGPALVWLHGGGWVIGSLASHDPLCRRLASLSGCTVVAVDYRLAPEHPHPAALDDAWAATVWATSAFDAVAVGGDSAGGHLAALVAVRARDRDLALALQVLVVPITDYTFDTVSYSENAIGYGLERATMEWFWRLYVPDSSQAADPEVSPLRTADLAAVAPALVLTAEYDPLRDEGEAYVTRLRRAGVPVEHQRVDGMVHGFLRMPGLFTRSTTAIELVAGRVAAALG